jgi:hypothetical protein
VAEFHLADALGYDRFYLHGEMLAPVDDAGHVDGSHIGIGDFAYTVGLFMLLAGKQRNLPIVHTGHIALMPGQEDIPIRDWDDPEGKLVRYVDGYLVEAQSLRGLSGSPVFVRPSLRDVPHGRFEMVGGQSRLYLLGIWQGAWDAPPDEVLAVGRGKDMRVPVGMGVVVPTKRLIEILEPPVLKEKRINRPPVARPASPD